MPMRVGIDLGGTKIEGVILDEDWRVVERRRIPTESERGYDHIVERVAALAIDLLDQAPRSTALGVGTPGAISAKSGLMKNCNTTCLNGRDLAVDLERRIGRQIRIENDANCFALAEASLGAAIGADVVFGVILGTGVGGGIVVGGRLITGRQQIAGEWGHHAIDRDGPDCYCGQRGCVETFISGPAVERDYRTQSGESIAMAEIVAGARAHASPAREVFERFLDRFGRALANVIDILDPDAVVLGGGLSNIDELYTAGREAVARRVFSDELRTPILRNALGDSAGVIGAALLAG